MNRFFYAFILAFTFNAIPAMAQDDSARTVEEVVVTALRKETNLQDTAITITAISSDDMELKQLENFEDLQFAVPTLTFGKGAYSGAGISLRGIGNFAVGNASSNAIGYFWNGQTASQSGLYEAEFFDVERVEVLRGPQGTLFGSGTTGGAVQMITVRPNAEFGGNLKADLADFDSTRLSGAVNLPLSDNLRSRFAFASLKRGGFVTNNYNGQELDGRNTMAGRASFEYDYSDDTVMTLIYEQTKTDDNRLRAARQFCKADTFFGCSPLERGMDAIESPGSYGHWVPYLQFQNPDLATGIYRNNPSDSIRTVDLDFTPEHTAKLQSTLFEIDSALSDTMNMVFTYSYHTRNYFDAADYDHSVSVVPYQMGPITTNLGKDSNSGYAGIGTRTYTSDQAVDFSTNESEWSQTELRFSSDYDGAFNFTAGLYHETIGSETDFRITAPYMSYWGDTSTGPICAIFSYTCGLGGAPFWSPFFSGLAAAAGQAPGLIAAGIITPAQAQGYVLNAAATAGAAAGVPALADWQSMYHNDSNLNRDSTAVYGEMYFDFSDVTRLTLGGRYSEYRIHDYAFSSLLDLQGQAVGVYNGVQPDPIHRIFEGDKFTYKVGLDHSLNDNSLLYATYSTGFKPGGSNPTDAEDGGPSLYDPEIVNVFEVGMKNTLMDGRLQLNLSAYHNELEGLQLSKIVRRSSINENADATITGVEAEFTFFVTNTLMIDGFVAQTDATIDEFASVDPINPGAATQILPYAPGATGFLGDFAPLAATCDPLVFLGQAAPSATCGLGLAASNAQLAALVKYANTDTGLVFKSFGPLCTQPFFGLDSTTLPCPVTDGVEQDLSGNKLPGSADLNYRLGVTKFVDTTAGTWTARADYSYRGDTESDTFNRKIGHVDAYSQVDVSLRYQPNDGNWFVGAYIRNLRDDDHVYAYYATDPTVGGFSNGVAIDPKIMGINFGMNF
ncbi:TonB-dependent receptor [Gammaproteobacteria bacterium]|nr:TonB-dependent receptor [Gammaproteobacteria bacterium]MDA8924662.1 TonB-dependent receptor [Gammaproteobacteria bacterium]MDA9340949.1 TonB-dependent receptor [Gammaproteobacteria bacterium]MDB9790647.1 TonB-dependent receptor [Gammaproteobacteria bacterium]MDC0091868.1 TonB-dependent receptor [Gammaproteobacteria bacterium]